MYSVRLVYEKNGSAAYISHLDLMKTIQRSLLRAGLPAAYSQGFNPHILLSVLAPLSTGYISRGDVCDFDITGDVSYDDIVAKLNTALPSGISALRAVPATRKPAEIAFSRYEIIYPCGDPAAMRKLFDGAVNVNKKSKRGQKTVDLRDYIASVAFEAKGECVICTAVLRMGGDPLNPAYITAALAENGIIPPECHPTYIRDALLDEKYEIFC